MKIKKSSIYMLLVFIVSGFLFSHIFSKPAATKIPWENITTTKTIYEYQTEINNLKLNDQELQDKIISYNEKLTSYSKENPDLETVTNELYNEQTKYDII
ncbi:MAG: hypothetical protein HGA49_08085, partial [Eubacteriaceae bacterium]|nr:hypothetical protein [Eubacteriaceae bacterium]